jgi:hypothetical protein
LLSTSCIHAVEKKVSKEKTARYRFYLGPGSAKVRTIEAWSYVAISISLLALGALFVQGARGPVAIVLVVAFALVLVVWGKTRPSNDRDWQPEVAMLRKL